MAIKALIIDDDPAMTELLGLLLRSYDIEVISSNDSERGLKMVAADNPDIVLLDLMMPGKNGWEVCSEIRTFSNVPIAILSAIDDPKMIASALDAGADDYMVKPIPSGELLSHINNLTRRANAEKKGSKAMIRETGSLTQKNEFQFDQKPLQA